MNEPATPVGVFISKGMHLRISNLRLSLLPDGSVELDPVVPELAYDMWPLWLQVAVRHERAALEARRRLEALTGDRDDRHGAALQDETKAGMVTIAAGVFAIDAFYGAVKDRIDNLPEQGPRSRRYAIVAETLKRAFTMSQASSNQLRGNLREVFRFRDRSVHPTGLFQPAERHPVLGVGVAVPHVAFRSENASKILTFAFEVIGQCAKVPKPRHKELVEWCVSIPENIQALRDERNGSPPQGGSQET